MSFFIEHRAAQPVEPEPPSPLPVYGLGNTALLALHHFFQARCAVAFRMFAHFDANIMTAHFVCDCGSCAGPEEAIKNKVSGISGDLNNTFNKAFWLWTFKYLRLSK